jgi:predicted acetylornithine/succinylornithine family transaminase
MDANIDFETVKRMDQANVMQTYRREEVCFSRGKGARLWDLSGKEYLDMAGGVAVNGLGHCHPAVVKALKAQAGRLIHTSNLYHIQRQAELASKLAPLLPAGLEKLFFGNSGTEAVEGALKLAVLSTGRRGIVAALNSFHGRTAAALGATGQEKYRKGLDGLLPASVSFVKYGDAEELEAKLSADTAAVILEPIQGEGGVVAPPEGYLRKARELCDRHGALLIFDEIQTGFGRTGKMFACQHEGVSPDIMTMAKALGGGMPIGAIAANGKAAAAFSAGTHGSTFGGNPLACAAACAVLDTLAARDLTNAAAKKGALLFRRLEALRAKYPALIKEVRGKGLMVGIAMEGEGAKAFKAYALSRRVLVNVAADTVVRLLPPLVITKRQITAFIAVLEDFCRGAPPAGQSL